jgi:hypothetical protein
MSIEDGSCQLKMKFIAGRVYVISPVILDSNIDSWNLRISVAE